MPELQSGIVRLKQRKFAFELTEKVSLDCDDKRRLYVITGDNGTGKTTFMELVIIPWLQKNNITFTCKGQDIQLQSIVERSLNAILGITLSRKKNLLAQVFFNTHTEEEPETLQQTWHPQGLLLDETDKFLSADELKKMVNVPDIRFVFIITHLLKKVDLQEIFSGFDQIININILDHTELRKVELTQW